MPLTPTELTQQAANYFQVIADDLCRQEKPTQTILSSITALIYDLFMTGIPLSSTFSQLIQAIDLSHSASAALKLAAELNWKSIEPAILGTLFERAIDPHKRAQLGAHYTSRNDILLILEPVLMQPLRRTWAEVQAQAAPRRHTYDHAANQRDKKAAEKDLLALREQMLTALRAITVLDPACGSGNFLYVALQTLLDLEKTVITDALWAGLPTETPQVHPKQLYGIEKNEIAHALASIVIWIGYIQWLDSNGYPLDCSPILDDLSQNIICQDAILALDADGKPTEPDWQPVEVIVGNPPFLGEKKLRRELGDGYIQQLQAVYQGRLSGNADLVTYWFERARAQIEHGRAKRAGFISTKTIRQPTNRMVLARIKHTGDIFMAWSDRPWVLEGATVGISMVGFDDGLETTRVLDGVPVNQINADLQNSIDATKAQPLHENRHLCFMGVTPAGKFDLDETLAQDMLQATNPSGKNNSEVVKPYYNGDDLAGRPRRQWTIDFGTALTEKEARAYELPFAHLETQMKPARMNSRQPSREKNKWWLYTRSRPEMRAKLAPLTRYIATPQTSKHRFFVWLEPEAVPSNLLLVIAREDDYFWGVLHSSIHEKWSIRMGSQLGTGPRYIPTATFETFPFPWSPAVTPPSNSLPVNGEGWGGVNFAHYQAIAAAAKQLHEERHAWLNPPKAPEAVLKQRTLTNLYNALKVYRGQAKISIKPAAGDFAPRLAELHQTLDRAVCAAYGWEESILEDEETLLRHLLALNLGRAKG